MTSRLDDREHGLRQLLPLADFPTHHLPVADIWIGVDADGAPLPNGLLIERKSAADLDASILDGRYREQRSRLMNYATECRAHPVYIIEGNLSGQRSLSKSALLKHLTRLAIRYHIAVFQVASLQETAELVLLLADQWRTDPTTFEQPATMTYVETQGKALGVTKKESVDNPHVFAVTVLRACQGVSAQIAEKLLEGCGGSLEGVWNASAEELAAIQCGKVRFGAVRGRRLWSLLHVEADVLAEARAEPIVKSTNPITRRPAAEPKPAAWERPMFE